MHPAHYPNYGEDDWNSSSESEDIDGGGLPVNNGAPIPCDCPQCRPDEGQGEEVETRISVKIDRKMLAELLEHDRYCRKEVSWPLHTLNEAVLFAKKFVFYPDENELLVPSRVGGRGENFFKFLPRPELELKCKDSVTYGQVAVAKLIRRYPKLDKLLSFYPGHMVAAGGAVCKATIMSSRDLPHSKDCDIFFHSCSTMEAENTIVAIVRWFFDSWEDQNFARRVYRNAHVTTLIDEDNDQYQIIHRVYQSKDAVIGGFDLAPSMILYDGEQILMTPLALFSYATGYFIPDTSRRSSSFDIRVAKYANNGFGLLLPCKSKEEVLATVFSSIVEPPPFAWMTIGEKLRYCVCDGSIWVAKAIHRRGTMVESDYDGFDDVNFDSTRKTNALLAARDNFEAMVWGGANFDAVFNRNKMKVPMLDTEECAELFNHVIELTETNERELEGRGHRRPYDYSRASLLGRWFGERYYQEVRVPCAENDIEFIVDNINHLSHQLKTNYAKFKNEYVGKIIWFGIEDNPGRQHTSSFHPVAETVSWYRPEVAKPLVIGLDHNVHIALRCGFQDRNSPLSIIGNNPQMRRMLLDYVRRANSIFPFARLPVL